MSEFFDFQEHTNFTFYLKLDNAEKMINKGKR